MKVIVTGGYGFIGQWVRKELLYQGHTPFVFDSNIGRGHNDITSLQDIMKQFQHMEACIHLAGVLGTNELFDYPTKAVDTNINGTINVLQACNLHEMQYVGITMPDVWKNLYQMTKRAAKEAAEIWHENYGTPISFVRAYNVYGPRQKLHGVKKIIPTFSHNAWRNQPIPIWGDGTQGVDLVWVGDVARLLVNALQFSDGEVIEAGTGFSMPVREVAQIILSHTKSEAGVTYLPMRRGEQPALPTLLSADVIQTKKLVGWFPHYQATALADTIDWYKDDRS